MHAPHLDPVGLTNSILLPPALQPLDISVNKPAKDFLREKFQDWYASQILQQLDSLVDIEDQELQPIDLSLPVL